MKERGQAILIFIVVVLVLALIGLFAVCTPGEDHHSLGKIQLVSHDYRGDQDCYRYGDCREGSGNDGDYRDDNRRGGISPGPFDRSPVDIHDNRLVVCFPFSRCDGKDGQEEPQPPAGTASLFPPTPTGIRDFVVNTTKAGRALGQAFATLTITFVSNLLVGIDAGGHATQFTSASTLLRWHPAS